MTTADWLLLTAVACFTALLTGAVRRYAIARDLLDRPNERSSHRAPTPRGGGIAIVATFLAALVVAPGIDDNVRVSLLAAGLGIALIGFIDDHGHIPARWRLLTHFGCAGIVVAGIGVPQIDIAGTSIALGRLGIPFALLYIVWMLNLYNFMDGIDGIAGVETLSVGIGAVAAYSVAGQLTSGESLLPLLLAAAALGFLMWNFPPAKIFMGDAGSGFLGMMLAALSLSAAVRHAPLLWSWIVLLGVFVVDATVTLIRRLVRGERIYEAHRSHAYQHAALALSAHRPVTLAVLGVNVFWLMPWAIAIAAGLVSGIIGVGIAYLPLLFVALHFRAGLR